MEDYVDYKLTVLICKLCNIKFIKRLTNQLYRVVHNTINMDGSKLLDYYCSEACYEGIVPGTMAKCGHPYINMGKTNGRAGIRWICLDCMTLNGEPSIRREPKISSDLESEYHTDNNTACKSESDPQGKNNNT